MKKMLLLFVPCLLLIGGGCSSDDAYISDYEEDTINFDDYYDEYADYSSIPQGTSTVYACDLDEGYCTYIDAYVEGGRVTSAFDNSNSEYLAPDNSTCDEIGCLFYDWYGDEWYFEF
jgi:major membrane immunogen (membrane-anchored lipoprotein)